MFWIHALEDLDRRATSCPSITIDQSVMRFVAVVNSALVRNRHPPLVDGFIDYERGSNCGIWFVR